MLKFKLLAVALTVVLGGIGFLSTRDRTAAQTGETAVKRDELLNRIADYKNWRQVQKPEKKTDEVLTIIDSAPAG
ncbi:MAG: hypothetical protein JSS81_04580 [Acidobacteria bacterium]|nr:hypothetical protein [Acidobacteriota bacterium]